MEPVIVPGGDARIVTVGVPVGERSYEVKVGHGARSLLASLMPISAKRAVVVTQAGIGFTVETGLPAEVVEIADGEAHKNLSTVEQLCRAFTRIGLTRNDVVVGVGGGLVTDVAGFAASAYHRGVAVVHVPTTLLAMVDAAIGGKTGVNLPEGKNLVGAFWQPSGVVCDLDALATLDDREMACGRGEMAKYHFLTGDDLLALDLTDRVARCVAIKAEVVAGDERESTSNPRGRALLNYGHTLAHALESAGHYDIRHGEAVAVGLVYAAELARVLGRVDAGRVARHREVLDAYGLSGALPSWAEAEPLIDLFARDKKAVDGVSFVLDGPTGLEVVSGIERSAMLEAMSRMERA
ncbi:MAG: 3-dehydroquinate synthase [Acidimicrobiia bacterium]